MLNIIQQYLLRSAQGKEEALEAALVDLAQIIRAQPGCKAITMFRDLTDPSMFLFIEDWDSKDSQSAAGKRLGGKAFAPTLSLIAGKPIIRLLMPAEPV